MNNRFSSSLAFALGLVVAPALPAQNIILKSGQTIESKAIRRSGDMIMSKIQVGASSGEIGYQSSTIAKIEFPEPPQLKTAALMLAQNQPAAALAEIEPVVKYYAPFRDITGNRWAPAALLKVAALGGLQLDKEAEALSDEIRRNAIDPEMARAAQLQLVTGLLRKGAYGKALQLCDRVIDESARLSVLAEAWVRKGDAFLAQREWDRAVLAYLRVPVFYENEVLSMPPALLGSARAFRGMDETEQAKKSLRDLIAGFPKSAQAETARAELEQMPK